MIQNYLKLSITGKPISFYEQKVLVDVTDTEIEVVAKSKFLDPVPTKRNPNENPDFRRLLAGVQKKIVGKVASQLQSQNDDLELLA